MFIRQVIIFLLTLCITGLGYTALAQDPALETDDGIGQYDYIEKASTSYVHYRTGYYGYDSSSVWVNVHSTGNIGHEYEGQYMSGSPPSVLNLSTNNIDPDLHLPEWIAGASIDMYLKVWDAGNVLHETPYVDELMILDVGTINVSTPLQFAEKQLVLQFSVDAGTNIGRKLTRLWVKNLGTLAEGFGSDDIDYDAIRLYYETGTAASFDGSEPYETLWGEWGASPTNDNRWGNENLESGSGGISIPSDGINKLLCYVVIENFNPGAVIGRTARFAVETDGMSLDPFGSMGMQKVRIDEKANSIELCLSPSPAFVDSPSGDICQFSNVVYSTQPGMSDYNWSIDGEENTDYLIVSGATDEESITLQWLTAGEKNVSVNYSINGCEGASPASVTNTVNEAPDTGQIYHD